MSRFQLTIDSTLSDLFVVSTLIRGVCDYLGADPAQAYWVELGAVEGVTNAIKHAYRGVPGQQVKIEISFVGNQLEVCVLDTGLKMGDEQIERLEKGSRVFHFDPKCLGSVPESGMGLQIIRETMDAADYSSRDGVNCLRLRKTLAEGTTAANRA